MRICAIIKFPPIQGGVSRFNWRLVHALAQTGHQVTVVTNANEVESNYRLALSDEDKARLTAHYDSGGWVKLVTTTPMSVRYKHIPSSNPFVTKLAGLATDSIIDNDCDFIFASYFEPYCIAALLASEWTNTPFVVQHAGSDLSRLMNQPDLTRSYKEMLRRAQGILTHNPRPFLGIGISRENIYEPEKPDLPDWFSPTVQPLDMNKMISKLQYQGYPLPNTRPIDPSKLILGVYGKPGPFKGARELIESAGRLHKRGYQFQLVFVSGLSDVLQSAAKETGIEDTVWIFPYIAPWKIPHFIAACSAIAFLEHDFPIKFHTPSVASEVFAVGKCLITTQEIIDKQRTATSGQFVAGENVILVDPWGAEHLDEALCFMLSHQDQLETIGKSGHLVFKESKKQSDLWAQSYERIFKSILERSKNQNRIDVTKPVDLRDVLQWMPRTTANFSSEMLITIWDSFCDLRPDKDRYNDLLLAWYFSRYILDSQKCTPDDPVRWDELRIWQLLDNSNDMFFETTDQLAFRKDMPLDAFRPFKNRFLRMESIQDKRLLFIRSPNLIDSPVLEINPEIEKIIQYCTGTYTVQQLEMSICPVEGLRDKLLTLYQYGAVVFS